MPEFISRAKQLLDEEERNNLIYYLSTHPKSGVIIKGTGGIRKLRWSRKGKGKSGGVRVIYLFHNENMPLFIVTIFAKGEKANLTKSERNEVAKLTNILISAYKLKK